MHRDRDGNTQHKEIHWDREMLRDMHRDGDADVHDPTAHAAGHRHKPRTRMIIGIGIEVLSRHWQKTKYPPTTTHKKKRGTKTYMKFNTALTLFRF